MAAGFVENLLLTQLFSSSCAGVSCENRECRITLFRDVASRPRFGLCLVPSRTSLHLMARSGSHQLLTRPLLLEITIITQNNHLQVKLLMTCEFQTLGCDGTVGLNPFNEVPAP